jgi:hypothetical protein
VYLSAARGVWYRGDARTSPVRAGVTDVPGCVPGQAPVAAPGAVPGYQACCRPFLQAHPDDGDSGHAGSPGVQPADAAVGEPAVGSRFVSGVAPRIGVHEAGCDERGALEEFEDMAV